MGVQTLVLEVVLMKMLQRSMAKLTLGGRHRCGHDSAVREKGLDEKVV